MNTKKIIGYKAPCDLFNREVKKDTLFVHWSAGITMYYPEGDQSGHFVPGEIVRTWEPVYEKSEEILYIGCRADGDKCKVIVSEAGVACEGVIYPISRIRQIMVQYMNKNEPIGHMEIGMPIYFTSVRIGCSTFTLEDGKKIDEAYKRINLET